MSGFDKMGKQTRLIGSIVLGFTILLAIAFFLRTGREDGSIHEPPDRAEHPIYSKYRFDRSGRVINFGIQPLYLTSGLITEAMKRDRVLDKALNELGMEIRYFPFLKGDDVNVFLKRHDLDMGVGGDMPTLSAAATMKIVIPVKIQQGFTSIVATRPMLTRNLRGNRIAYPFGSISHFVVLDLLESEGLGESDADLVPLDISKLAVALNSGKIDAFAAWEPIAAMGMKTYPEFVATYQQLTTGYLYFLKDFCDKSPEAAPQIVAAVVRAFRWMKKKRAHLLLACKWSRNAGEKLTGQKIPLTDEEIAQLAEKDILGLLSVPVISRADLNEKGFMFREFEFLKRLKKIPPATEWNEIRRSFDLQIISGVLANPDHYDLDTFDYDSGRTKSAHGGIK